LKDIWPTDAEVASAMRKALDPELFKKIYTDFATQNPRWNEIPAAVGNVYEWDRDSTYIQEPPFFEQFGVTAAIPTEIHGARALAIFGDSITTDHISPAGSIKKDSPAGRYLDASGVPAAEFNSYGSRRGNDRVMTRGTFANVRVKNLLVPGVEGGVTIYTDSAAPATPPTVLPIYDAAEKYRAAGTPLIVVGGEDYGMGSSRDWAAKGTALLGVRAVIAKSFERIHRSNLVGMGVLPLNFKDKADYDSVLAHPGAVYDLLDLPVAGFQPGREIILRVRPITGAAFDVPLIVRIDTPIEADYYRAGGILPHVLAQLLTK
jgi:aconitate hydratase